MGHKCLLRAQIYFTESCNPHYSFNKHPKKFLYLPRLAPTLTDGSDEPFLGMKESWKEYELNKDQPSASSVTFKIQRAFTLIWGILQNGFDSRGTTHSVTIF